MFQLLCFAIIRLLHYLLDTYMCKTIGWDILVISRESVGMICIISKFIQLVINLDIIQIMPTTFPATLV
jgi:hypothetical protein